jgi:hypothetical protein
MIINIEINYFSLKEISKRKPIIILRVISILEVIPIMIMGVVIM